MKADDPSPQMPSDWFGKTLIFSSRLSHTRLFPKFLRFSYSYLLVGVPVGPEPTSSGPVTVDAIERGWFSINGEDHLERGSMPLNDKVNDYLLTVGYSRNDFPYIYLLCAPKFLGYQFNPASLWFFYDCEKALRAILVEVNNTFGERHLYWCPGNQTSRSPGGTSCSLKYEWRKEFHVSPFNSRKGSYSLYALDPFADQRCLDHLVDARITLMSNHGKAKLVARVQSTTHPLDPASMSRWHVLKLTSLWWWVGILTYPRILLQASRLYFRRKLHVWYRPEVRIGSISQAPTWGEQTIEAFFRLLLGEMARALPPGTSLSYTAAFKPPDVPRSQTWSEAITTGRPSQIKIHVTSPAFYSRLIFYQTISAALHSEGIGSREENRTVQVSGMNDFDALRMGPVEAVSPKTGISCWLLQNLRELSSEQSYTGTTEADGDLSNQKSCPRDIPELDRYVLFKCRRSEHAMYLTAVLGILVRRILSKYAFGLMFSFAIFMGLIRLTTSTWQTVLCA